VSNSFRMRSSLRRTVLAGVVAALALTTVVPSYADHDKGQGKSQDHKHGQDKGDQPDRPQPVDPCTGDPADVQRMALPVEGQDALALVALPHKKARGIVVFDHGYGHTMESWREHITRTASNLGVIAIAPNYRGQDIPAEGHRISSRGWRVAEGAADTIAYAQHFEQLCKPTGVNVVYGVSMGGNTSGLVVASKPMGPDGKPLFDYWVDVEGAVNVTQTYLGASALAPGNAFAKNAAEDIEAAFGGSIAEVPEVYAERTVVNRTADIAASGIRGVVMVHGVADGLVTYNQSRELQSLLRARGVPVDMWTAVTRSSTSEPGTTVDGYLPTGRTSPFAGHASETSTTHVVGLAGFAALDRLYAGRRFVCGEAVYDGMLERTATATSGC
jgi:acetyl esterase/lipase